jgi:hypothetical protein
MTATGPALPGDYNLNHVVDGADYVMWRKAKGSTASPIFSGSDGDGNGVVNDGDYTVLRKNFGNAMGTGAGAASSTDAVAADAAGAASLRMDVRAELATGEILNEVGHVSIVCESRPAAVDAALDLLLLNMPTCGVTEVTGTALEGGASEDWQMGISPIDETAGELAAAWRGV